MVAGKRSLEGVRGGVIYCTSGGINFREYGQITHTNRKDGRAEIQIRGQLLGGNMKIKIFSDCFSFPFGRGR